MKKAYFPLSHLPRALCIISESEELQRATSSAVFVIVAQEEIIRNWILVASNMTFWNICFVTMSEMDTI